MRSFELHLTLPISPNELYDAWLDSAKHSAMTGSESVCSAEVGGTFSAWDDYISGENIELTAGERILQSWRTTDFDDDMDSSLLDISFEKVAGGCRMTLLHTQIPEGLPDYKRGWVEHYFEPMAIHFG